MVNRIAQEWMEHIFKIWRAYSHQNPCPWRSRIVPFPCCGGAQPATECCPAATLRTAPGRRPVLGCCSIESSLEVHPQGWVLVRNQKGVDRMLSAAHIHFNTRMPWCKSKVITHKYLPIFVLEVRGSDVGEDSSGRVSESVILRMVWECLLSPLSFTSSSAWGAPLKLQRQERTLFLLVAKNMRKKGSSGTRYICTTCRSEQIFLSVLKKEVLNCNIYNGL